ncbi:MAG: radical SAM protein [Elusimicrobiota bacterium]
MDIRRILLVRTFRPVGTGGPVPPLGLLYIAAAIRRARADCEVQLLDAGNEDLAAADVRRRIEAWHPDVVGLSTMTCEEELMREIARGAKDADPALRVIVGGPHTNTAGERVLDCPYIDAAVIQEGEETIIELLEALEEKRPLDSVRGIAYRREDGTGALTAPRPPIEVLDSVPFPAWDLIDIPSYSRHRNWNGTLKRSFYAPLCTSRGCPYACTFCHNIFGKTVRRRSPERVVAEMRDLYDRLDCREFHVVDDIFNVDAARAADICRRIIDSGMDISLSFPNGLRADIMTDELLALLKKAGTYKINYGFETATPRLQKTIKKNVDIPKAREVFRKTSRAGIITGAYFMLGIPTETRAEMRDTIRFAATSELDFAAFFKSTAYPGTAIYEAVRGEAAAEPEPGGYDDMHFFSVGRSMAEVPPEELNALILEAQRRFFFQPRRMLRGLRKAPRKMPHLRGLLEAAILSLQGYLAQELKSGPAPEA